MYHRTVRRTVAVTLLTLVWVLSLTAPAVAGTWRGIGVTIHDLQANKEPTLVIFCSLADDVELPVKVEIPVPKGVGVSWVGEILGGDPKNDLMTPIEMEKRATYDVITATITTGRAIQAELTVPEDWVTRGQSDISIAMTWTSIDDIPGARLGFEIPAQYRAIDLAPEGASGMRTNQGVLYAVETTPVAAGQILTLSGTIIAGADPDIAPAEPTAEASAPVAEAAAHTAAPVTPREPIDPADLVLPALIGLVAVLVVVLVLQMRRGAAVADDASGPVAGDEDDGEPEDRALSD